MSELTPEFRKKYGISPLHYGQGGNNEIYAYTTAEWGIGASNPGGGTYQTRSMFVMALITLVSIPTATVAVIMFWACVFSLNPLAFFMLPLALLFTGGVMVGGKAVIDEWKARPLRKAKGLPKPWYGVTDDQAYEWFLKNPRPDVPLTLEYFPQSYKLKEQAKWAERQTDAEDSNSKDAAQP